jgi:acetaldehyde dehydrogenase (acetylating)
VPSGTRALIAVLEGVGRDHPLSIEKLCPVLSYFVVNDWKEGCERCKQVLRYGGMGHTMSVHATDDDVILEFGLHKPAFRIVVNTPTTHGSVGMTTGLDPAMTLGCGGWGGNITSDNISPIHLLNIKRVAYELRPAVAPAPGPAGLQVPMSDSGSTLRPVVPERVRTLDATTLSARIDSFLSSRGIGKDSTLVLGGSGEAALPRQASSNPAGSGPGEPLPAAPAPVGVENTGPPVDFVCEDDVRQALRAGRRIRLAARAIVTPAARELGESQGVFVGE